MKNGKTIKHLSTTAWKLMSEYVRQSEAVNGYCTCVSCGFIEHWKNFDAGHFVHAGTGGKQNPVSYDFRNIHSQCRFCNRQIGAKHRHPGNVTIMYTRYMIRNYGDGIIDQLEAIKKQPWFRFEELQTQISILKVKLGELK